MFTWHLPMQITPINIEDVALVMHTAQILHVFPTIIFKFRLECIRWTVWICTALVCRVWMSFVVETWTARSNSWDQTQRIWISCQCLAREFFWFTFGKWKR